MDKQTFLYGCILSGMLANSTDCPSVKDIDRAWKFTQRAIANCELNMNGELL